METCGGTWLNNKFLFNGVGSIDIAWMQSNDITPPILEATIDGQRLTQGAYIGTEPEIRIYLRDESGIDLANTKYFKNGYSWDTEGNVDINQNGHLTSITLTPNLSLNDRSISFITSILWAIFPILWISNFCNRRYGNIRLW